MKKVIVSLTSYPAAIHFVPKAVKSILNGTVLPDMVILYLTFSQFPNSEIPMELTEMAKENPIFKIRDYKEDIRSYRKLYPAIIDFPEAIIVTIDDDVAYHKNMLHKLLAAHEKYPNAIIAHRVKQIKMDSPYRKWRKYRWYHYFWKDLQPKYDNLQTGVGGVLYPPNSLKKEMLDTALFTEIAPTVDDIWFWAAAVANGVKLAPVRFGYSKPRGLGKPKAESLKYINFKSGEDVNRTVFEKIINIFPIIKERLEKKSI